MAKVELTMQSLGIETTTCCDRQFERGETMHAIVSDKGEALGWWCYQCIKAQRKVKEHQDG